MSCTTWRLRLVTSGPDMLDTLLVLEQVTGEDDPLSASWISAYLFHPSYGGPLHRVPEFGGDTPPPCQVSLCPEPAEGA